MTSPSPEEWNTMFRAFALCSLFLFTKYFAILIYAANLKNHPPEDKPLFGDDTPPDIEKRQRVFANDLENIPFNVALFWGAFIVQNFANMSGHGKNETRALTVLFIIYCVARFLFTICYVFSFQPWRTILFFVGNCAVGAVSIVSVISAFNVDVGNLTF